LGGGHQSSVTSLVASQRDIMEKIVPSGSRWNDLLTLNSKSLELVIYKKQCLQ
jgi:hypothetical protein